MSASRNVPLSLAFAFSLSLSETSWGYTALSAYLRDLAGNNTYVGLAEGFQGIAQLAAAMFSGWMADKGHSGRQGPLRVGAAIGAMALAGFWAAMGTHEGGMTEYWLAAACIALWGVFRGVTYAPHEALFADSVTTESRARLTSRKFVCTTLGASSGPLLAVALFKYFGDDWKLSQLRTVIAAGTGLALLPLSLLLLMRDEYALPSGVSSPNLEIVEEKANAQRVRRLCFAADALGGIASGATIRFFPLFFKDETKLSPANVNAIMIVTPFLMAISCIALERLASRIGRVQVILGSKLCGIGLLFWMGLNKQAWTRWEIIVPVYIVRTVVMNATSPLHKSILMDHCLRGARGRWNAADSITAFGWSGSAFVGGVVADAYGFGATFLVTASLQLLALAFIVMLWPLVPAPGVQRKAQVAPASQSSTLEGDQSDLRQPLIVPGSGGGVTRVEVVDAEAA